MATLIKFCIRWILNILAYISTIVCPLYFVKRIAICMNYVLSRRFCYLSRNFSAKVYIEYPFHIYGHKRIQISSLYSRSGFRLECIERYGNQCFDPSIIIGKNVCLNFRCHIGAINQIIIGDNVLIGSNVLITDHSHGINDDEDIDIAPSKRKLYSKGPVIIEDNVWIGENVSILPNVRIGKNSIIGANSVVLKDVPAFSIVAGNPAKVIKCIKDNSIEG